jgi:rhodanese-related sulfurtransferase
MNKLEPAKLIDLDPITVQHYLDTDQAILVDVREPDEFLEEHIPGAVPFPLSRFDAGALPSAGDRKTVLACFIGGRSERAAELLFAAGHSEAFHLDGGLFALKEAGLATES